jgi:hypothetical protein
MARFHQFPPGDVPARLTAWTPQQWGDGEDGIRAWRDAACAWLAEDTERRLPVGRTGTGLDVRREAIRLLHEAWWPGGQGRDRDLTFPVADSRGAVTWPE